MDNLDRINDKIRDVQDVLHQNGYYEDYNTDPTTFTHRNDEEGSSVLITMREMNIEGYFYIKFLGMKGKWKKEYTSSAKLLKALETHFNDEIREGKINNLLDEI